jgi:hypothetical protein
MGPFSGFGCLRDPGRPAAGDGLLGSVGRWRDHPEAQWQILPSPPRQYRVERELIIVPSATPLSSASSQAEIRFPGQPRKTLGQADKLDYFLTDTDRPGTEWVEDACLDRAKLGPGSGGVADEESGLLRQGAQIQCTERYTVGLMKGSLWPGSKGLVHRSPRTRIPPTQRVLFKIDVAGEQSPHRPGEGQ